MVIWYSRKVGSEKEENTKTANPETWQQKGLIYAESVHVMLPCLLEVKGNERSYML